jgi:hypothetical protein
MRGAGSEYDDGKWKCLKCGRKWIFREDAPIPPNVSHHVTNVYTTAPETPVPDMTQEEPDMTQEEADRYLDEFIREGEKTEGEKTAHRQGYFLFIVYAILLAVVIFGPFWTWWGRLILCVVVAKTIWGRSRL